MQDYGQIFRNHAGTTQLSVRNYTIKTAAYQSVSITQTVAGNQQRMQGMTMGHRRQLVTHGG